MPDNALPFRNMSQRIEHNEQGGFGGAFVIVPPDGAAPMETLILDATSDAAQFFMLLQARITTRLKEIEEAERLNPYSRR